MQNNTELEYRVLFEEYIGNQWIAFSGRPGTFEDISWQYIWMSGKGNCQYRSVLTEARPKSNTTWPNPLDPTTGLLRGPARRFYPGSIAHFTRPPAEIPANQIKPARDQWIPCGLTEKQFLDRAKIRSFVWIGAAYELKKHLRVAEIVGIEYIPGNSQVQVELKDGRKLSYSWIWLHLLDDNGGEVQSS